MDRRGVIGMVGIGVLLLVWILVARALWAQDAVEGWNQAWPIEGNTNVSIYTNWIAADLWKAADERLRALGPASQVSNDVYGFNFVYTVTGEVGRTAATWAVVWTNHGTATTAWVTNWFPVYGAVTVTNRFDALTAGGVTGSPALRVEFLNQLDDAILTALGSYVMPYYDDSPAVPKRYNGWFSLTNGAGVRPVMFPLASKVDMADKYGRAGGQHYAQAIGQETNAYGQATNGVGVFVKRWNRPMFLPLAEWTCTGTSWTERTFWQSTYKASLWGGAASVGYQYGPGAYMRLESRLLGNVGTPRWRWYPGKTNSTFSSMTAEWGDPALVTVYDRTRMVRSLDTYYSPSHTETIAGTNQAADMAYLHWISPPTITGTGTNGDRLVLVWQEPQFTTWEDSEAWDAELFKEALDARWKFLDLMRYTVASSWSWVNASWYTNQTARTNTPAWSTNGDFAGIVGWTNVYGPEKVFPWWKSSNDFPWVAGWDLDPVDWLIGGDVTNALGDGHAPELRLTLYPYLWFVESADWDSDDWYFEKPTNYDAIAFSGSGDQEGWSLCSADISNRLAQLAADQIWTGRQHRVHWYTHGEGVLYDQTSGDITTWGTNPISRWTVSDWTYDQAVTSDVVQASQNAPSTNWTVLGSNVYSAANLTPYTINVDTSVPPDGIADVTVWKLEAHESAQQYESRTLGMRATLEGGPHMIEWNFWKR